MIIDELFSLEDNKVMNIFENKTSYDKLHNNDNDTNDLMMMKTLRLSDSLWRSPWHLKPAEAPGIEPPHLQLGRCPKLASCGNEARLQWPEPPRCRWRSSGRSTQRPWPQYQLRGTAPKEGGHIYLFFIKGSLVWKLPSYGRLSWAAFSPSSSSSSSSWEV